MKPRPVPVSRRTLITCEHARASVPKEFTHLFEKSRQVLGTHRALDIGTLPFARQLARTFNCPLHEGQVTRLLVDLNRSLNHRTLYSEYSRPLPTRVRTQLLERYFLPYRRKVFDSVSACLAYPPVVHLSIHSFVPVLKGITRRADFGILFDPRRPKEVELAGILRDRVKAIAPALRVYFNQPYRGAGEGVTTGLRNWLSDNAYLGIEIELNQGKHEQWQDRRFLRALSESWRDAVANL